MVTDSSAEELFKSKLGIKGIDAIKRLQQGMDASMVEPIEEEEEIDKGLRKRNSSKKKRKTMRMKKIHMIPTSSYAQHHGSRNRTSPSTLQSTKAFEDHLRVTCQIECKASYRSCRKALGGGSTVSPSTPKSKNHLEQKHVG